MFWWNKSINMVCFLALWFNLGKKILIRCPLIKLISSRQQVYPNFTKSTKLAPISRLKKWIFARIFKIYKIDGLILKNAVIYNCSPKLWPLSNGVKLMSLYLKTLKISLYVETISFLPNRRKKKVSQNHVTFLE